MLPCNGGHCNTTSRFRQINVQRALCEDGRYVNYTRAQEYDYDCNQRSTDETERSKKEKKRLYTRA